MNNHINLQDLVSLNNPFTKAITNEDINEIKILLKKGADINSDYILGQTPLHSAIRIGRSVSFIKDLLELGADPNIKEKMEGRTPLFDAAWSENEPLVSILLDYGANPNISDKDKWTPLFCSAWRGHVSITKTLISYGANKGARDIYGKTPLEKAKENNQLDVQSVLEIYTKTNTNIFNQLVRNIRKGDIEAIELTLAEGFPVNMCNERGDTLLINAVKEKNKDIINLLIMFGIKLNRFNYKGNTALMYATKLKDLEIIKILLENGANPIIKTKQTFSAVEIASSKGSSELVELFNKYSEYIFSDNIDNEEFNRVELDRHEIMVLAQDIMQGDVIIDTSITSENVRVQYILPRSEMGENIVLAVTKMNENKFLTIPDIEVSYNRKVLISRLKV